MCKAVFTAVAGSLLYWADLQLAAFVLLFVAITFVAVALVFDDDDVEEELSR